MQTMQTMRWTQTMESKTNEITNGENAKVAAFATSSAWLRLGAIAVLTFFGLFYFRSQGVTPIRSAAVSVGMSIFFLLLWLVESRWTTNAPTPPKKRSSFDWGMHYVRGFAIVCILLTHFFQKTDAVRFAHAFLLSSTIYFLFISGYLCQFLAFRHPVVAKTYYFSKLKNVIAPYVVFTIATILAMLIINAKRAGIIAPADISLKAMPNIFLLGWAQRQYWYIPFVTVLFLISPWLTRTGNRTLVWLSVVSFVLAVCFPYRPSSHLTWDIPMSLYRLVYFSWAYFFGFAYARWKKQIDLDLGAYAIPAFLIGMALGIGMLSRTKVAWLPSHFLSGPFALSFQKILFLIPILYVANKVRSVRIPLFDWLATYSFTLFFLHYFFLSDYAALQAAIFSHMGAAMLPKLCVRIGLSVLFVGQCLILSILLKTACGRWSRSFVGS